MKHENKGFPPTRSFSADSDQHRQPPLFYIAAYIGFVILLTGLILLLILFLQQISGNRILPFPDAQDTVNAPEADGNVVTIVLDAGHGGEDGGAVGHVGGREIYEKDINLAICKILRDLLEQNGIPVGMTREEDTLLYNRDVDFHGRKKILDLEARLQIGQRTPNGIFVSVHMNSFPQNQYHGLQVYYSPNHPLSHTMAENIQETASSTLQPDNHRKVKAATSSIFLLDRLECPAILVECGFLSHEEECAALSTEDYQQKMAFLLFASLCQTLREQKVTP